MTDKIGTLLNTDPLWEAEKATGKSYKDDELTAHLGMLGHMIRAEELHAALDEAGDTRRGLDISAYCSIVANAGFDPISYVPFKNHDDDDELLCIFWKSDEGLLLVFDSYYGSINRAKCYWNLKLYDDGHWPTGYSGGGARDDTSVLCGDIHAIDGLLYNLSRLRLCGEFMPKWIERPWLWLLHWQDTKVSGYDCKAINAARIAALSDDVREAMGDVTR